MDWKEQADRVEYLRRLGTGWWKNPNTVVAVAKMLDQHGVFADTGQIISYFETPQHYQHEIDSIIEQEG